QIDDSQILTGIQPLLEFLSRDPVASQAPEKHATLHVLPPDPKGKEQDDEQKQARPHRREIRQQQFQLSAEEEAEDDIAPTPESRTRGIVQQKVSEAEFGVARQRRGHGVQPRYE